MQISVSGKQIDVGTALTEHVEDRILKGVEKYFENAIKADVVFSKESHLSCVDIVVNEGTGLGPTIKSQGKSEDIYTAFESAADRIEKQLRRYKSKIKDHHKKRLNDVVPPATGTKYVIENTEEDHSEENPIIIANKPTHIETISVSDAVMRMNLANWPALMFINEKTGTISVVYNREDGNISWVDSGLAAQS